MKKILIITTIVVLFGLQATTNAQMHQGMMNDSAQWKGQHFGMHPGMMHGDNFMHNRNNMQNEEFQKPDAHMMMMHHFALAQCFAIINKLPKMQEELSLTDDQVFKLIDLQAGFKKQNVDLMAELTKEQIKLKSLVKANASTNDVSAVIKSCANTMSNIGIAAYDVSSKMKAVLNDNQKQKLNEVLERNGHDDDFGDSDMSD